MDKPHPVETEAELDAVLDDFEARRDDDGFPLQIDIIDQDADPDLRPGLTIGLGHPQRSFVCYGGHTADESGYAVQDDLPEWPDTIVWNGGGAINEHEPWRTRLTPHTARSIAREYTRTATRPTSVRWEWQD